MKEPSRNMAQTFRRGTITTNVGSQTMKSFTLTHCLKPPSMGTQTMDSFLSARHSRPHIVGTQTVNSFLLSHHNISPMMTKPPLVRALLFKVPAQRMVRQPMIPRPGPSTTMRPPARHPVRPLMMPRQRRPIPRLPAPLPRRTPSPPTPQYLEITEPAPRKQIRDVSPTTIVRQDSSVDLAVPRERTYSEYRALHRPRGISTFVLFAHDDSIQFEKGDESLKKHRKGGKPKLIKCIDFRLAYVLFASYNLFVLIVGSMVMTIGIQSYINVVNLLRWIRWDKIANNYESFNGVAVLRWFSSIFIGLGVLTVVVGLLGFFGFIMRKKKWIVYYLSMLITLVALQIVGLILAYALNDKVKSAMRNDVLREIKENYGSELDTSFTQCWDFIQVTLECCGSTGPADFVDSPWYEGRDLNETVPASCCRMKNKDAFLNSEKFDLFDETCPVSKPGKNKEYTSRSCSDAAELFVMSRAVTILVAFFFVMLGEIIASCTAASMAELLDDGINKQLARQRKERTQQQEKHFDPVLLPSRSTAV